MGLSFLPLQMQAFKRFSESLRKRGLADCHSPSLAVTVGALESSEMLVRTEASKEPSDFGGEPLGG